MIARRVSIGECELHVEEAGQGQPLMFVAGLGGIGRFWANQVEPFARDRRVILHDHRGVGRSGAAPIIDTTAAMADDVLRLMDVLDIERAHLVGHSTGGAIGQHIALRAPERLLSLTLSASWAGPTPLFEQTFRTRRDVLIHSGALNYYMIGTLLAVPASWLGSRFTSAVDYFAPRLADYPGLDVELARLNAVMTHDLRDRIAGINVPTFVIGAHDDQLTPPELSRELATSIGGARLHLLDRGGHFCPATATGQYNAALREFLDAADSAETLSRRPS